MRITLSGICTCLLLLVVHAGFSQCPAPVSLSISNVVTTESRCQASGTATIQLTGGTAPFAYSITAGPVQFPAQSTDLFQSLPPGNYTVRVTDNCNTTVTANFVITGSYSVPNPGHQFTPPTCTGGNDGSIILGVTDGRPPFTYALINPSPVTVAPQASNQFTGLPGGSYTYEITDSCGNFQTRTVTLPDGDNGAFYISRGRLHYEACDSFSMTYTVYPINPASIRLPYSFTLTLPDGTTKTHVFNTYAFQGNGYIIADTFHFRYHHVPGAQDPVPIDGINNCGYTSPSYAFLDMLDMFPNRIPTACSRDLNYSFEGAADNSPTAPYTYHCNTITYTLVSPAGHILATQTNNSTFAGYPPGLHYKVVREDCCMKDSIYFNWEQKDPLKITYIEARAADVCKEGTAGVWILINHLTQGSIILASGPPSISFPDGTVHNYVYPDTVSQMPFGSTSVKINYFGAGTYTIYAVDTCGERDTATFTITPAQLRHSTFTTNLIKGCINDNKIIMNAESNGAQWDANMWIDQQPYYPAAYPYTDSAINVPAGTYTTMYAYRSQIAPWGFLKGMNVYSCDTITGTVIVPPYTQPAFAMTPAVAVCGGIRSVALLPDSSHGVLPYRYQITAGATTTSLQNDNTFTNLSSGMYTFLMADACGNSFSNSVAIDTLRVPAVQVTGTACQGSSTTLSLPVNPYYTYSWLYPNGHVVNGNSITLNPVTQNDIGRYVVTVNSNINGCSDSKTQALQVNLCSVVTLPLNLLHFSGNRQGNAIVLKWKTTDEINTSHFMIERSTDGVRFTAIQKVNASGTETGNYIAIDNQPPTGKLFYRLHMVDKDGKAAYSAVISINNEGNNTITVTPRLVTGNNDIKVTHAAATTTTAIQITGIDGRIWLTQPVAKSSVQTTIHTDSLAKGNYFVVYISNGARTAVQIVKL